MGKLYTHFMQKIFFLLTRNRIIQRLKMYCLFFNIYFLKLSSVIFFVNMYSCVLKMIHFKHHIFALHPRQKRLSIRGRWHYTSKLIILPYMSRRQSCLKKFGFQQKGKQKIRKGTREKGA